MNYGNHTARQASPSIELRPYANYVNVDSRNTCTVPAPMFRSLDNHGHHCAIPAGHVLPTHTPIITHRSIPLQSNAGNFVCPSGWRYTMGSRDTISNVTLSRSHPPCMPSINSHPTMVASSESTHMQHSATSSVEMPHNMYGTNIIRPRSLQQDDTTSYVATHQSCNVQLGLTTSPRLSASGMQFSKVPHADGQQLSMTAQHKANHAVPQQGTSDKAVPVSYLENGEHGTSQKLTGSVVTSGALPATNEPVTSTVTATPQTTAVPYTSGTMQLGVTIAPTSTLSASAKDAYATVTSKVIKTLDKNNINPKCTECGKEFKDQSALVRHVRIHTGEKPFSCKICDKRFGRKEHVRLHAVRHTGEKPYVCTTCDKRFYEKNKLRVHMRTHTGEKPYPCETCDMRFAHNHSLQAHMRTHTGERPYSCEICDKKFSLRHNLKSHEQIHSGEKAFPCTICDRRFHVKTRLRRHLKTHDVTIEKRTRKPRKLEKARQRKASNPRKRKVVSDSAHTMKTRSKHPTDDYDTDTEEDIPAIVKYPELIRDCEIGVKQTTNASTENELSS